MAGSQKGGTELSDAECGEKTTAHSTLPNSTSRENLALLGLDRHKVDRILKACRDRDLEVLAELASSEGGLVEDYCRRTAWPLLLGCPQSQGAWQQDWSTLERHRDEEQVELDVHRSFVYYPENETETSMKVRKQELSNVITAVLRQHPLLCYFQGYHDIVQVLLLVLGPDAAGPAAARLSLLRIRDFMLPTLAGAEVHLHLLPAILHVADNQLYRHLSGASKPTPFFALAATLTLYAHDIEEYGDIARLFDFLLAGEAALPVYLFATIVMSRKDELLEIDHDEPEMLHSILSKLPKPLNLEGLIRSARDLFAQFRPEQLPNRVWWSVSSHSVLKTTRDARALATQDLQDGERHFAKHAAEIQTRDALRYAKQRLQALAHRYRRPARWTGAAILVAVLALHSGRSSGPANLNGWLAYAYGLHHSAQQLVARYW
ncbi:related to GTPase-activating protein gyp10 [Ramularia collo-cygni]|uniref:Related to GTPase-activating protein gyp10 n=1 Tax=Ramularia collo-cygni TaxID=112498 RepID=A0A2D3UTU7_9PEZI|nr:related to GTPase-activating protein gyp10 [Ramularia collo-cygni]CZT19921.1 related to GTPase-activating protein gyp10 [Ramularia collo-cygni]